MKTVVPHYSLSPIPDFVSKDLWNREYLVNHSIPSSTRYVPAKGFLLFSDLLDLGPGKNVLDVGCGNGRNAVYIAKKGATVTALDFADSALNETTRRASEAGLAKEIYTVNHCLSSQIPFKNGSFDFVLDSYMSCHFLNERLVRAFWKDVARLVKPSGRVLSLLFSPEDEYYGELLSNQPNAPLVQDPSSQIWKRLYDESAVKSLFADDFRFVYFAKFEFDDIVFSKTYKRVILVSVLRPR